MSIFDDEPLDKVSKAVVEIYLKSNYRGRWFISDAPAADGMHEVYAKGSITVTNKSLKHLTGGLFRWTKVGESFNCSMCTQLESLSGCPVEVGDIFSCANCTSLTHLRVHL